LRNLVFLSVILKQVKKNTSNNLVSENIVISSQGVIYSN